MRSYMAASLLLLLVNLVSTAAQTCRNGFDGIEGGTSCCDVGCRACTSKNNCGVNQDNGLDGDDCCADQILANGVLCSDVTEAPCILETLDTVCDTNGFAGFEGTAADGVTLICCSNGCGQCGGGGCAASWAPLDGSDCCADTVEADGNLCSTTGVSPCIITEACQENSDCDEVGGEICCPTRNVCEIPVSAGACGDPHMTGFRGQKFDFVGEDGDWYCVLEDGPALQLNMRVTSPVPSVPEITYISGISIRTTDLDGLSHTVVIQVTDPHNLAGSCPEGVSPCLADGALSVEVDGRRVLSTPGTVYVGSGASISAVNLPGACRSFGFEEYWERKKRENAQVGRKLGVTGSMQDMAEWILEDPTATNMDECVEYVAHATAEGGRGLFAHESEHASFQIMTPLGAIRLSHGRLHQLPMRDPTDQFELPDHLAWQMNLAIDHNNVSPAASGILGETLTPTVDGNGKEITQGMAVIRGSPEDYRVVGPLETSFALGKNPA